jgi:hypothetical protein
MLIFYGGRGVGRRVEELAQAAKGLDGDRRLGGELRGGAGGLIQHPGGNL